MGFLCCAEKTSVRAFFSKKTKRTIRYTQMHKIHFSSCFLHSFSYIPLFLAGQKKNQKKKEKGKIKLIEFLFCSDTVRARRSGGDSVFETSTVVAPSVARKTADEMRNCLQIGFYREKKRENTIIITRRCYIDICR